MNPVRRDACVALACMLGTAGAAVLSKPTRAVAEVGGGLRLDEAFPSTFADWNVDRTLRPVVPNPQVQRFVESIYDQTLARTYANALGYRVMLSAAYGGRQNDSMDAHRPEQCYPAQGFTVQKGSWRATLPVAERPLPVRRMVASLGARHEPITYWLVVGREVAQFGLEHKWVTLKYGLTGHIPDGMLVRVSSIDTNESRAFAMQDRFLIELLAHLQPTFRLRLLGALHD